MIVVIDGYNLIKQILGSKRISHKQRDQFVVQLAQYLKKRGLKGVVVFDGGESTYPYSVKKGNVTIIFSGYKETADEVIASYLQEHKEYELLLISSDRALRNYAETLDKQTMNATEFYYRYLENKPVPEKGSGDQTLFKMTDNAPEELDELMLEATEEVEFKKEDLPEETEIPRHKSIKKRSKKERRRKKLLDKLE